MNRLSTALDIAKTLTLFAFDVMIELVMSAANGILEKHIAENSDSSVVVLTINREV